MSNKPHTGSVDELLRALNGALRVSQLYPRGHQAVTEGLTRAEHALRLLLQSRSTVTLVVLEQELIFEERAVYQSGQIAGFLIKSLKGHGADRLIFRPGCTAKELGELIDLLQQSPEDVAGMAGIQHALEARGVRTMSLERLTVSTLHPKEESNLIFPGRDAARKLPESLLVRAQIGLDELLAGVKSQKPILIDESKAYVNELTKNLGADESPLLSLALMESYEDQWLKHLVRVSTLSVAFARRMGFNQRETEMLGTASFIYDIGLLSISGDRKAIDREGLEYQRHPLEGVRLLLSGKNIDKLSVVIAFEHHMGHDLSGFPKVTGKRRVHPLAELVGLADRFIELVSPSGEGKGLRNDQAILELSRDVGGKLDPRLFAAFVAVTGVFAPGTFVKMNDGTIGMVLSGHPDHVLRPVVRLILDSEREILTEETDVDLVTQPVSLHITEAVDPVTLPLDPNRYWRALRMERS